MRLFIPLLLLIFMSVASLQPASAQCTPDSTFGNALGIFPVQTDTGRIGIAYDQILNVVVPEDTAVEFPGFGLINLDICGFQIDSIPNLPDGLVVDCSEPDCIFTVDHFDADSIIRVCARISGTPTERVDGDTLNIHVSFAPGTANEQTETCDPLPLNLPPEQTSQILRLVLVIEDPTAITDYVDNDFKLEVYPNPSRDVSRVSFELPEAANVSVQLKDMFGRNVQQLFDGRKLPGAHQLDVNFDGLATGMYFLQVDFNNNERSLVKKILHN